MTTATCPVELNRLFCWPRGKGGNGRYRFVRFDARRGRLAFYPLDGGSAGTQFPLVVVPVDEVERALAGGGLVEVPDTERTAHMYSKGEGLTPVDARRWARRLAIIAALLDTGRVVSACAGIGSIDAIFFDPAVFHSAIRCVGDQFQLRPARIAQLVAQWLHYGADDAAVIPLTEHSGAKRQSHGDSRERKKPGVRSAYELKHHCMLIRFNEFWRARVMAAIIAYRLDSENWEEAVARLRQRKSFYKYVRDNFSFVPGHRDDPHPPGIDGAHIPSLFSINAHKRTMLDELRAEMFPPLVDLPTGGNASDLCEERLLVVDMDGLVLDFIDIVVEEDGRQLVLGPPTLILVIARRSNCIVGWYLTMRPESALCYCYALYNALSDKAPRLRQLGFEQVPPGIVSGAIDEIFIDRGPGRGRQFLEVATKLLGIGLQWGRTKVPEDKGDVESGGGLVQTQVRDQETSLKNSWLIEQTRASLQARVATLPTGVITAERLKTYRAERRRGKIPDKVQSSLRGCDWMVAEAVSSINTNWKSDSLGLTLSMRVQGTPNTRVGIHAAMLESRRGNARAPWSETDLLWRTLPTYDDCKLRRGAIRKNNVTYGGNREDDCGSEAAAALAEYAKQWRQDHPNERGAPPLAPIVIPPYGNCAYWLNGSRVIVIPARVKARESYGEAADLEIIEFLNFELNSGKREDEIQGVLDSRAKASRRAQEASRRIMEVANRDPARETFNVKMAAKSQAREAARQKEDLTRFNEVAQKLGLPIVVAPEAPAASPSLKDAVITPRPVPEEGEGEGEDDSRNGVQ
ncbi:hypothetical protein [Cupriavidus pauculus]|uniref:hypothetical protein n=1 Tax=Cupriavidus pauculus TaxID=82633 RepID=UPI0012476B89|nr:hypothetical protein [Cupriavidus pauculus]KAB0601035.1 hypothetical protein F7R19_18335 [Cupriavidus pauculus]UAL01965.1 hypothetical protein K8O84_24430 [Cupriavidus pauculus]